MGAMPFQSHIFDNADATLGAARSMLAAYSAAGEEPTLLAPTPTAALRGGSVRVRIARRDARILDCR